MSRPIPMTCQALACSTAIPPATPDRIFCPDHWDRLPDNFRREIYAAHVEGQTADPSKATPEWSLAVVRARNALAVREGRLTRDAAASEERRVRDVVEAYRKQRAKGLYLQAKDAEDSQYGHKADGSKGDGPCGR